MKLKTLRKIIFLSVLAFIGISISLFFLREFIFNYLVRFNLNDIQLPGASSRALIFSPHNDDEVLGAGELINHTIKNGGQVKVVFITNGDGFRNAIELDYFKLAPRPVDYIKFGYQRQKESVKALKMLGLSGKDIIFLGYPDGGILYLWNGNWDSDNPYKSNHIHTDKSPYNNSYTPGAPYTGQSLVSDISKIISEYKPTHIVFPHPNDRHPDHFSTNSFVKYALTSINYVPEKEWLYLIHRGDWPAPMRKEKGMYLVPPSKLLGIGTQWYSLDLNDDDIDEKTRAIHIYKTQLRTLGLLMTAFERKNELFGEYNNLKIVSSVRADNEIQPTLENRVIIDPLQDALTLQVLKESDITGVYAEISKQNNLHIFLETDSNARALVKYYINIVFFYNNRILRLDLEAKGKELKTDNISKQSIKDIGKSTLETKGKILHVTMPYNVVGDFKHVFINANTSFEGHMMDKTAWRMIDR